MYGVGKGTSDEKLIVMEYFELGNLQSLLENTRKKEGQFSTIELSWMCTHVARGMEFLATRSPKPIVHNDLATRNVLVCFNDRKTESEYLLKITGS